MESILINDNEESLVPLSIATDIKCYPNYYKKGVKHAISECFVRESVFERLINAASYLPKGVTLVVLDGWRPFLVQQYFFSQLYSQYHQHPKFRHCSEAALIEIVRKQVSPPCSDPKKPSPHLTGGSVDVTLCDRFGRILDLGTAFDQDSSLSWSSALESTKYIDTLSAHYRRELYFAMIQAGFTNLPSEWWHYDFGNQLWAYYSDQAYARYGMTEPPPFISTNITNL
ncbi:M15 family metallopeptidase [Photobacterium sp. ZSDE20]|uniref:D-alanyl-D-alanine dipeptidase n=1 Tax=Photobacterium pectinilyticum TaxID=2906793 RepID=A0ABT1N1Q3_9GAMM|nr:M15 family metallopeptidase [Photobacterium sp. ZSDE20]MCQ1058665.1 M15 family metallopeptidase [Photobacterium sp. ZSDE20]